MKLWEVMRLLEEDPSRKFEYQDDQKKWRLYADAGCCDDRVFYMLDCWDNKGERGRVLSGSLHGNFSTLDNWQPVRQPVTWQEAIQAWGAGRIVSVEVGGCKYLFADAPNPELTRRVIQFGTWYVED